MHAHPDDETLSTGALLATWATAGLPVTVVTCTRGEQGEVIVPALARLEGDGPALAAHREGELAEALVALGVTDHLFLDRVALPDDDARGPVRYVDSGMAWAGAGRATATERVPDGAFVSVDPVEAASRLAIVLRRRRPDVVVGYEPGGGYGHPDHVRAHEVTHRAVELAADPGVVLGGAPVWTVPVVLWSVLDERAVRAARRDLAEEAPRLPDPRRPPSLLTLADPAGPLPSGAVAPSAIDLWVDVVPVLDRVLAALRAHRTQVQAVGAVQAAEVAPPGPVPTGPVVQGARTGPAVGRYALSDGVLTPLSATECYRFAPGDPVGPGPGRGPAPGWPPGVLARRGPDELDGSVTG